jgi:hypothetical protein
MLLNSIDLDQARERHERLAADAARSRELDRPAVSLRRTIGHGFIQLGRRIAAEPRLELYRSSR